MVETTSGAAYLRNRRFIKAAARTASGVVAALRKTVCQQEPATKKRVTFKKQVTFKKAGTI